MTGTKVFKKEAVIKKFIDVKFVNEILLRRVLRKTNYQETAGPIVIVGNVKFNGNITVTNHLNGTSIEKFEKFTLSEDAYVVHGKCTHSFMGNGAMLVVLGDMIFENVTEIDKLNIYGFLNEQNVSEFLNNMVFTNNKRKSLSTTVIFKKHVSDIIFQFITNITEMLVRS